MKPLAFIIAFALMNGAAWADEMRWPDLKPGEIRLIENGAAVPKVAQETSGFGQLAAIPKNVKFTFFRTPGRGDFLIISPCCGPQGGGASLFELIGDHLRGVPLTMGDPRKGFYTQPFADAISVDEGAKSLRVRLSTLLEDCAEGSWGYYYLFDNIDRPALVSVIDTCGHIGVRQLYHSSTVDLGHWWQKK